MESMPTEKYVTLQDSEEHTLFPKINVGKGLIQDGHNGLLSVNARDFRGLYFNGNNEGELSVNLGSGLEFGQRSNGNEPITLKIGTGLKFAADGTLYVDNG